MRVSPVDENATPEIAELAKKIRGARGGQLHIFYKALLHSPGLAAAWFEFNNAVRFATSLGDRTREIIIMRVAFLTGCEYVWSVHEAQYAKPAGLEAREITALRERGKAAGFEPREQALIAYVDAMTLTVAVPDDVFQAMGRHFSEREVAEVTVLAGAYNMQTRVLRALGIESWKP